MSELAEKERDDARSSRPFALMRPPPAALHGLVTRIGGWQENGSQLDHVVEAASLISPLIISFGAPYSVALGRTPGVGDEHLSFAAGLYPGYIVMSSTGASACIQIDFTPLGAYRFFGLPMCELASRMVALGDLDDPELALLKRRLEDAESWTARLDIAEAFVAGRLQRGPAVSAGVASAYRELAFCHGEIRIAAIAERLDWSRKHLSQRFQEEIGISPKQLARILRFNHVLAISVQSNAPDWAGLAAECGYADQAHLNREFLEFTGTTPTRWQPRAA